MSDRIGAFVFDKGRADLGKRRPGLFTSDLGDVEKVQRMRKARGVAAILDSPADVEQKRMRRRVPVAVYETKPGPGILEEGSTPSPGSPSQMGGPSMTGRLALAKSDRAAAKLANEDMFEPEGSSSMVDQLAAARCKAGK